MVLSPNSCVYLAMGIRMDEPFTLSRYCNDILKNKGLGVLAWILKWTYVKLAISRELYTILWALFVINDVMMFICDKKWCILLLRFSCSSSELFKFIKNMTGSYFTPQSEEMRRFAWQLPLLLISIMQKHKHN